jgi:hypothetical protein
MSLRSDQAVRQIVIAFDIDGTLRDNTIQDRLVANERIRTLLITLASMKNTTIMLWSGGGAKYARQVAAAMAIEQYIDVYEDKKYGGYDAQGHPIFPHESEARHRLRRHPGVRTRRSEPDRR